jgi:tryptophan synthase alpha chain
MSRLADAFKQKPALIGYVMAGDPDTTHHLAYARAVMAGCDILEIGIPFSDPVADGPTIERAAVRALAGGARLADALSLAKELRGRESEKPIVLMTYYNPVFRYGVERFARACREVGVDGVILPDVPLEESGAAAGPLAREGIDLIQLASPASPPERLARLAKATRGFLYVVSSFGVTGARVGMAPETRELVGRAAAACRGVVPFAVGFGVSDASHVRALAEAGADGVVVGSAIVSRIADGETPEKVGAFVRGLRG